MCRRILIPSLLALSIGVTSVAAAKDIRRLPIGAAAPDFRLPGVDGREHTLVEYADAKVLVFIFTCNHCPTAQAYEDRIVKLHADFKDKGVELICISPNDAEAVRLDELGYSEYGDSLEDTKRRAEERGFKFPYLYDGETQSMSTEYGVLATPHVFIFDQSRKLRYNGRIDDREVGEPTSHDARNAIEALLAGKPVPAETTRVFGCSTKWAEKRDNARKSLDKWNAEPVELKTVDPAGLKTLVANKTENYRLINVWSTTCVPCVAELPALVEINRMYRGRHFEMHTITLDPPENSDEALKFLKKYRVAMPNHIFNSDDRDALAEALDAEWQGPVPYTILLAPGGKIVYRCDEAFEPIELKKEIVNRLGRTYASRKEKN